MSVFSVSRTIYEEDVRDVVKDLNRKSIEVFKKQNGFKGIRPFFSRDRHEIMLLIEWEDESCYRACQMSQEWGALFPRWNELMSRQKLSLEVGLYQDMDQVH